MNPHKMKAVLLDIEAVLAPPTCSDTERHMAGIRNAYDTLVSLGAELPDFRTAFRLIFHSIQAMNLGLVYGNLREIDLEQEVGGLLSKVVPGIGSDDLQRTLDAWFEPFKEMYTPAPGAPEELALLSRSGFRIHAGVNTPWSRRLMEGALSGFDSALGVTLSSEVHHRRPNLNFYFAVLDALDLPGEQVIYATVFRGGEVSAAEEAGMMPVSLLRPGARDLCRAARLSEVPACLPPSPLGEV